MLSPSISRRNSPRQQWRGDQMTTSLRNFYGWMPSSCAIAAEGSVGVLNHWFDVAAMASPSDEGTEIRSQAAEPETAQAVTTKAKT